MNEEYFTISRLNHFIKDVLNAGMPAPVWVCGEIQGFDRNRGKNHIFFELVEKDPQSHDVVAKINLVIFAGRKLVIDDLLRRNGNTFALKDDIEVKFQCKVDFYPPHGAVRLSVETIDPIYTLGRIAQEKQKLINLLKEKGTLDQNKKIDLPLVPLNIGLITAYDSAAYNDFLSELNKSGFAFTVHVRNTLMQGKKTESDVCQALRELADMDDMDLIVITRGGGSIADLSCFDSRMIAEAVAQCPLPVLSGIGHEINTTITDMAAHTYAKTPTAIAQFIVSRVSDFMNTLDEHLWRLTELAPMKIEENKQGLKEAAADLRNHTLHFLREYNDKLVRFHEVLSKRPLVVIKENQKLWEQSRELLSKSIRQRLDSDIERLKNYQKLIAMVHPENTLKRGFTITRLKNGKLLKSIKEAPAGSQLETQVVDGVVSSQVKLSTIKDVSEEDLELFSK